MLEDLQAEALKVSVLSILLEFANDAAFIDVSVSYQPLQVNSSFMLGGGNGPSSGTGMNGSFSLTGLRDSSDLENELSKSIAKAIEYASLVGTISSKCPSSDCATAADMSLLISAQSTTTASFQEIVPQKPLRPKNSFRSPKVTSKSRVITEGTRSPAPGPSFMATGTLVVKVSVHFETSSSQQNLNFATEELLSSFGGSLHVSRLASTALLAEVSSEAEDDAASVGSTVSIEVILPVSLKAPTDRTASERKSLSVRSLTLVPQVESPKEDPADSPDLVPVIHTVPNSEEDLSDLSDLSSAAPSTSTDAAVAPICSSSPAGSLVPATKTDKLHVLVVEDTVIVQKALSRCLSKLGCNVSVASNGKVGLNVLKSNTPVHIVFCDFLMPVMDGISMMRAHSEWLEAQEVQGENVLNLDATDEANVAPAKKIEEVAVGPLLVSEVDIEHNAESLRRNEKPLVVGMSATALSIDQLQAFECGMHIFSQKPVPVELLITIVQVVGSELQNTLSKNCNSSIADSDSTVLGSAVPLGLARGIGEGHDNGVGNSSNGVGDTNETKPNASNIENMVRVIHQKWSSHSASAARRIRSYLDPVL